ncbi:DUF692 family multinuclear iron-containing protein [Arthrobacter sp. ZGTC131]|uniref:multinuclear nonheme iron-dependent oxidase n=1 Tax=Arthrobacter sp. ZGTC131 TaxID=2058898 RepID=UPI000CE54DC9|nr:DUF692 family multinuclear iron-containing protein [Arthrobacter sp. ZGTC131]
MNALESLPELGIGFIYWPSLEGLLDLGESPIDVLEIEPQPFWFPPRSSSGAYELDPRAFDHFRQLLQPKLIHGVGFPVGGTVAPHPGQVAAFVESVNVLGAPWASEHLSFSRVPNNGVDVDMGFLLPPLQSPQGVSVAVANITALKARLPVPFAFETGVSYLRSLDGELSDGAYFAAVAEAADCGILLDLHNVWANERNGRQKVLDLIEELPLERVIELHLAGGQDYNGYWVDAHSDLVPAALMDLARRVVPQLPNLKAIIYEVMPQYVVANGISKSQLVDQFWELRDLWELRGRHAEKSLAVQTKENIEGDSMLPSPHVWEEAVRTAMTGSHEPATELAADLQADPGIGVVHALVRAVRAGKVADTLTLTTRLLLLTLGEERLQDVLEDFWDAVPSEEMASNEALNFVAHINGSPAGKEIMYLHELTSFELAAHRAVMTGEPQSVVFSVDPNLLLSALRQGHLPSRLIPGNFQVTVSPPFDPLARHASGRLTSNDM